MLYADEMLKIRRQLQQAARPFGQSRSRGLNREWLNEMERSRAVVKSRCCLRPPGYQPYFMRFNTMFGEYVCLNCGRGHKP